MRRGKAVDIKATETGGEVTVEKFSRSAKLIASAGVWTRFSPFQVGRSNYMTLRWQLGTAEDSNLISAS